MTVRVASLVILIILIINVSPHSELQTTPWTEHRTEGKIDRISCGLRRVYDFVVKAHHNDTDSCIPGTITKKEEELIACWLGL